MSLEHRCRAVLAELDPLDPDPGWLFGSPEAFDRELRKVVHQRFPDHAAELEAELLGWGPLQALWSDPGVQELSLNGDGHAWVVRDSRREPTGLVLEPRRAQALLEAQLARAGAHLSRRQPLVDATLADGSRLSAQHASVAGSEGPTFTLRRQVGGWRDLDQLRSEGVLDRTTQDLLERAVERGLAVLVAGSMGAGKTTLLSALLGCVPADRRIVSLEDVAELRMPEGRNWTRLLARAAGSEGTGEIDHAALLRACKRMGADVIVVGEVRGAEAAELLVAMQTGDDSSLGSIHADDAHSALTGFARMATQGGLPADEAVLRVAQAVDLVVFVSWDRSSGQRRVLELARPRLDEGRLETRTVLRWTGTHWALLDLMFASRLDL